MTKFLASTQILALSLPHLPKTKPNILAKAKKEHWKTQETTGRGGVALTFEVPEHYLTGGSAPMNRKITLYAAQQAAEQSYKMAQIVGDVDVEKFVEMFTALCKIDQEPQPSMSHNVRKAKAGQGSNVIAGDGNVQINQKKG